MDKKAKDILVKTYWTSAGWKSSQNHTTDAADFQYAKEQGYMFDPLSISKPELVTQLQELLQTVSLKKITDAFLSSLTNKRLDWRSGLGSYSNAKRLLTKNTIDDYSYGHGTNKDLNILNFERIKWGGVRHINGLYNWLDLTLLSKENITPPTKQDIQTMQFILDVIRDSEMEETPSKLRDRLKEVMNVSKNERHSIIELLACADILKPLHSDRKEHWKHDWTFALHWRGEDKYDKSNVQHYFGEYGIR